MEQVSFITVPSLLLGLFVVLLTIVLSLLFKKKRKVKITDVTNQSLEKGDTPLSTIKSNESVNRNNINNSGNSEKNSGLLISIHKKTQQKRKRSHSRSKSFTEDDILKSPVSTPPVSPSRSEASNNNDNEDDDGFFMKDDDKENAKNQHRDIINQFTNEESKSGVLNNVENEKRDNIIVIQNSNNNNYLSNEMKKQIIDHHRHDGDHHQNGTSNFRKRHNPPIIPQKSSPFLVFSNANTTNDKKNDEPSNSQIHPLSPETSKKDILRSPSFHRRSRSVVSFESALSPSRPTCPKCGIIISTILREVFCSQCGAKLPSSTQEWIDPLERKKSNHTDLLIQVKGRRFLQIRQVELSNTSLNHGDVFILDCNSKIFQWNGRDANRMEKAKATDVCLRIKEKERIGKAEIIILEDSDSSLDHDDIYNEKDLQRFENESLFWKTLGGKPEIIKSEEEGGVDDENLCESILYKIDENQETKQSIIKPVSCPKLMKEYLHSDGCYILDCGSEFWMWKGKKSSGKKRRDLESLGKKLFVEKSNERPQWAAVNSMWEGAEKVLFMEKFVNWGKIPINVQPAPIIERKKEEEKPFDIRQMLFTIEELMEQRKKLEREVVRSGLSKRKGAPDNGKQGTVKIWRTSRDSRHELHPSIYGHFWEQDSYIVLYSFQYNGHDEHIIYFWQGTESSVTIKGASAVLTIFLNEHLEGVTEQIRVPQYKEPDHFINIFDFLVFHRGSTPSFAHSNTSLFGTNHFTELNNNSENNGQIDNNDDDDEMSESEKRVELSIQILNSGYYRIRDRYIVQLQGNELSYNLNGNDCYLIPISSPFRTTMTIVNGKNCSQLSMKISTLFVNRLKSLNQSIMQSKCNRGGDHLRNHNHGDGDVDDCKSELRIFSSIDEFMNNDNKNEYQIGNDIDDEKLRYLCEVIGETEKSLLDTKHSKTRVFISSYASGFYTCDEISNPSQSDFEESSLFIVDCQPEAIYVWEGTQSNERDKKRTLEISIEYRNALVSHHSLSSHLPVLHIYQNREPRSFTNQFLSWRKKETTSLLSLKSEIVNVEEEVKKYKQTYTLEELQKKPSHLDLTQLEYYLSDEEFLRVFQVSKEEWDSLQSWKKTGLKKNARIF